MTRRESILKTIIAGLATITTGNGYLNTIPSTKIKHWYVSAVKETETLWLNLTDQDEHTFTDKGYEEVIRLTIEITVKSSDNYAALCRLVQDIEKYFYNSRSAYLTKYGYWHVKPVNSESGMDLSDRKRGVQEIVFEIHHRLESKFVGPDTTVWT